MLTRISSNNQSVRISIVGIGNELLADDSAGILAVKALEQKGLPEDTVQLIAAHTAPESFTGPIRRFNPDVVIIVDAAQSADALVGSILWLEYDQIDGMSASTHTLPPTMFATFLMNESNCQVVMLGVQAGDLSFCEQASPEVQQAAEEIAEGISQIIIN